MSLYSFNNSNPSTGSFYITRLFSELSNRWYPGSIYYTNIYYVFNAFAEQFVKFYNNYQQYINNTALETVSTSSINNRTYSQMYATYGYLVDSSKQSQQDFLDYNYTNAMQPYVNTIAMLNKAAYTGLRSSGLDTIGQAYTGVAPDYIEQAVDYKGWNLTVETLDVLGIDTHYMYLNTTRSSGSIEHSNIIELPNVNIFGNTTKVLSYSKLGLNTKIYSRKETNSSLMTTFFGNLNTYNFASGSLKNAIINSAAKMLRADFAIRPFYSNGYSNWRPNSSQQDLYIQNNKLVNWDRISDITTVTSSILPLASGSYIYSYDWNSTFYNSASASLLVRSYPAAVIPDTVYYKEVKNSTPPYLMPTSGSLHYISKYISSSGSVFVDMNSAGLTMDQYSGTASVTISKRKDKFSTALDHTYYYASAINRVGTYNAFTVEAWIKGIDTYAQNVSIKLEEMNVSNAHTLEADGLGMFIDTLNKKLRVEIGSAINNIQVDLPILSELPSRYHYLAASYASGSLYIVLDNTLLKTETNVPMYTCNDDTVISMICSGSAVVIDEFQIHNQFIDPDSLIARFEETKSYVTDKKLLLSNNNLYHQAKWVFNNANTREVEIQQFSAKYKYLHLTAPTGSIDCQSPVTITWDSNNLQYVALEYTLDNGSHWYPINIKPDLTMASGSNTHVLLASSGSYYWDPTSYGITNASGGIRVVDIMTHLSDVSMNIHGIISGRILLEDGFYILQEDTGMLLL